MQFLSRFFNTSINITLLLILSVTIGQLLEASCTISMEDRAQGCLLGAAVGDMLGAPVEFIPSKVAIKKAYGPHGITGIENLSPKGAQEYPYTDDTAMARLVMQALIEAKKNNLNLDKTMLRIKRYFIKDMHNSNGWAKPERAPGKTCLKNVRTLSLFERMDANWIDIMWQGGGHDDGGCGSVMRAHPFGIVFAEEPAKAITWAAEHSNITHGAPMARAACAALAAGVATAMLAKDCASIARAMIQTAEKYDLETAQMLKQTVVYAIEHGSTQESLKQLVKKFPVYTRPLTEEQVYERFQGWTAHEAIAAGLYTFLRYPDNPKKCILLGVNTPGDSDSIASIAGALVGAHNGIQAIPHEWVTHLEDHKNLCALARTVS